MLEGVLQALGGLGLFLLGMSILTQGLRVAADERLRMLLKSSTKSPLHGVLTGGVSTAVLQSSSAVTVAAVGFVNAGLFEFPEALGIIFGANIGTTITGWLVALLGFKLKLGIVSLPLVLLGVLFKLFGRGKWEAFGTAVAGFGLIFIGISTMQAGMQDFSGVITPETFPPDTLAGRVLLVLIGVAITIVTQSSSAGVATALVALHAGSISLNQAAAMVIGMDLGTTSTAVIATIGGSVQAKRTGYAHVLYNSWTALIAFSILTPYMIAVDFLIPGASVNSPSIVLVSFHTFFNVVGVSSILPFTRQFSSILERLVPERGNVLTQRLDKTLVATPAIALDAVAATIQDIVHAVFGELARWLKAPTEVADPQTVRDVDDALTRTRQYLHLVRISPDNVEMNREYLACVHTLDHLGRVNRRLQDQARLRTCRTIRQLSALTDTLATSSQAIAAAEFPLAAEQAESFHQLNHNLKNGMRAFRNDAVSRAARGEVAPEEAIRQMDAARWLRRIGYHIWRVAHHMTAESPQPPAEPPPAAESATPVA